MTVDFSGDTYMSAIILREAVEKYLKETGFTYKELAERLDWWVVTETGGTKPDTKHLVELLRVRPSHSPGSLWIKEDIAVKIIRVINRAPNEFGF